MKYINKSDGIIKFRANNKEGIKQRFELKPGEIMESDREVRYGHLELVEEKKEEKKEKKAKDKEVK